MEINDQELIQELLSAGAASAEAESLQNIASLCRKLQGRYAGEPRPKLRLPPGFGVPLMFSAFALSLLLLVLSLRSLPGELLHPLKAAAETVATAIDPSLQVGVMMDDSREVKDLAAGHKPDRQILAALSAYDKAYDATKRGEQYAAWAYCAAELSDASRLTSGSTARIIERSVGQIKE